MDQATIDRIRTDYPAFASLLDIPDVANLLNQAAVEGWDIGKLQANVYASNWWTTHSESQRNAQILQRTDPGGYGRQVDVKASDIYNEAQRLGWTLSWADALWLGTRALNEGWGPSEITGQIVLHWRNSGAPMGIGQIAANTRAIQAMGEQYGVSIAETQATKFAADVAAGLQTLDGVKQYFFNQAYFKATVEGNEQIAQGLQAGYTVWDIVQPTLGLMAEELEIPVNTLSLTKGIGQQMLNYRDPDTNQLRTMTQSEATQLARSQPEWRKTNRAGAIVSEGINAISQAMGVKS